MQPSRGQGRDGDGGAGGARRGSGSGAGTVQRPPEPSRPPLGRPRTPRKAAPLRPAPRSPFRTRRLTSTRCARTRSRVGLRSPARAPLHHRSLFQRIRPAPRSMAARQAAPCAKCVAACNDQLRCRHLRCALRTDRCDSCCREPMARHASDRGASSPHLGCRWARGGDTRRRAAPLSNPRPAKPRRQSWPIARRNELEP